MSGYEITSWDFVILIVGFMWSGAAIGGLLVWIYATAKIVKLKMRLEDCENY